MSNGQPDGPSKFLMKVIDDHGGTKPLNWYVRNTNLINGFNDTIIVLHSSDISHRFYDLITLCHFKSTFLFLIVIILCLFLRYNDQQG